jgi:hypothetical protein
MLQARALILLFWLGSAMSQSLVVDSTNSHAANSFSPVRALGAAVDRLGIGVAEKELTGSMLQVLLDSGWQSISYRQNTELHAEAWHWNPRGTWSDSEKGYFTGSATPTETIRHSYGYALPHRGTTRAARGGTTYFSRLTDGDLGSYWKSNPYLTRSFTGEDDSLHPQWVIVDLGSLQPVNAIRILWAEPHATRYRVQFWTGGEQNPRRATTGLWQTFPAGTVNDGRGGTFTLPLTTFQTPTARYIRILMTASSNTCDTHGSGDRRNCVGYAIGEVYIGSISTDGELHDLVKHVAGTGQTTTICSSVDPWHEGSDINEKAGEQVGFDFFFTSGVTRGLPAMVPVAILYGTPEDAAAEIAYLETRKYPISYVELGEEPDGQRAMPEDYAALYLQWAAAIHKVDPNLKLGGPAFEGVNEDIKVWPEADGRVSWFGRFLDYLKAHGRISDLEFMSFEHYPYTPCQSKWEDLYREPALITHIMDVWKDDGLPANIPMLMTEGNISSRGGSTAVDIFGGLWLADYIGAFFTAGGTASYYFHLVSNPLGAGCGDSGGGALTFLNMDRDYKMRGHLSQYFASQLITREWVQPVDVPHRIFRVSSDARDKAGNLLVTAYAVLRPDGQWSLLIINKDHDNAQSVRIAFEDSGAMSFFSGPVRMVSYGAAQFQWHFAGADSYADPDLPPAASSLTSGAATSFTLPKASVNVIQGRIARPSGIY